MRKKLIAIVTLVLMLTAAIVMATAVQSCVPPTPPPKPKMVTLIVLKFCAKPVAEFGTDFGGITPDVGNYTVAVGTNMMFSGVNSNPMFKLYSWDYNGVDSYGIDVNITVIQNNSVLYAYFIPRSF